MRFYCLGLGAARGDRQHPGIDGASALNVVGRVADDQDFLTTERGIQKTAAAAPSDGGDFIAIFMIVGECPGLEDVPQIIMAQFDLRAQPDVAGQQTNRRRLGKPPKLMNEFADATEDTALRLRQQVIKPENVAVKKPAEIFR